MWLLTSFQMLPELRGVVRFETIAEASARSLLASGFESAVGHELTTRLLSERLELPVSMNRAPREGDTTLVAQLRLPRGAEGILPSAEELSRTELKFVRVSVGSCKSVTSASFPKCPNVRRTIGSL